MPNFLNRSHKKSWEVIWKLEGFFQLWRHARGKDFWTKLLVFLWLMFFLWPSLFFTPSYVNLKKINNCIVFYHHFLQFLISQETLKPLLYNKKHTVHKNLYSVASLLWLEVLWLRQYTCLIELCVHFKKLDSGSTSGLFSQNVEVNKRDI